MPKRRRRHTRGQLTAAAAPCGHKVEVEVFGGFGSLRPDLVAQYLPNPFAQMARRRQLMSEAVVAGGA